MSKRAYPCVGGPLDGEHACTDDFVRGTPEKYRGVSWFSEPGMYAHLRDEYIEYNAARRSSKQPSMVFVHTSLLKPVISARQR